MPTVPPRSDATMLDTDRLLQFRVALLALLPPLHYGLTEIDIDTEEAVQAQPVITVRMRCIQMTPIEQEWKQTTPYYEGKR